MSAQFLGKDERRFQKSPLGVSACPQVPKVTGEPITPTYEIPESNLASAATQAIAYKKVSESICNTKARLWNAAET